MRKVIVIVLGREVILGTALAAERLPIGDLLKVVQTAGDAAIAVRVERIQVDARPAVDAGVDLGAVKDEQD